MGTKRDPIHEWREQYARRWLSLDFEPLPDTPFRASIEPVFDELRVVRAKLSPGVTFRDKELVKDGEDAFGFMFSLSGGVHVAHQRRELHLDQGDATLLHVCETGTVGSSRDFGWMTIMVPQVEIDSRVACADDTVMRRLPRRSEALRLLLDYLRSVERNRPDTSEALRDVVRRHIIDLVELAITRHGAIGESRACAVVAARISAALDHIAARYWDPELTVAAVARGLGISARYLQRLLEMSGTSFTERLTELRLQGAFALLSETSDRARRISDIALDVGFSDVSHFNRLFRSRFGDTPSGVRAGRRL